MLPWIRLNWKAILHVWYKLATVVGFLSGALFPSSYIPTGFCQRILFMLIVAVGIFLIAAIYICSRDTVTFWEKGGGKITAIYGDLFQIASQKCSGGQFIVIPVNTTFDTIVEDSNIKKPLVAPKTLHGQWIKKCEKYGLSIDKIDKQINSALSDVRAIKEIPREQKERGKLKEYPIGTVVPVIGQEETIFLLVALSKFDKNNNAHANRNDVSKAVYELINYCDQNGQQKPVYIPLMGTGLSRANISKNEALHLIKYTLLACSSNIHENVTLVVYEGDKCSVPILSVPILGE